ncbi:MAG: hypothetical protein P4N59_03845 [Negativicutes bacterium]|nr:hypothetical protein [Negativicutes bacterium]
MEKVKPMLSSNKGKYRRILQRLSEAEEALKKEYGIENFDPMMGAFNHQHMNHTVFLMKCAYYAGILAGGTMKHE